MLPEVASYLHTCEGEAVTKLTNEKIPYFNAPIYLENKIQIGKVEEILGPINEAVSFFLSHVSARTARDCVYVFSRANWFYLRMRLSSRQSIAHVLGPKQQLPELFTIYCIVHQWFFGSTCTVVSTWSGFCEELNVEHAEFPNNVCFWIIWRFEPLLGGIRLSFGEKLQSGFWVLMFCIGLLQLQHLNQICCRHWCDVSVDCKLGFWMSDPGKAWVLWGFRDDGAKELILAFGRLWVMSSLLTSFTNVYRRFEMFYLNLIF